MALFDTTWYVNFGDGSTTGYYAVPVWSTGATIAAGVFRRQTAPAVGSERLFVCIIAGTTHATTEPTWTTTRGAKTTDNTVTWQECTGMAGPNESTQTNAPTTAQTRSQAITLGEVIYDSGSSSLQICSTAGTDGAGTPSFSATAGTTTADNTTTWTSLGNISGYTGGQYPHARLMNAAANTWSQVVSGVGSTIYVLSASQETQSSAITTPANASVALSPFTIICVSGSHFPPTNADITMGATIGTTGASNITDGLIAYRYGLTYSAGSAANSAGIFLTVNAFSKFDTCTFKINNTNAASTISPGGNLANLIGPILQKCSFIFGATGQSMLVLNNTGGWTIIGGTIAPSGSVPTTLFTPQTAHYSNCLLRDVDLSAVTGTIIAVSSWTQGAFKIQNCKLGSGVTISSGTFVGPYDPSIQLANSDSTSTNYRYYFQNYGATVQQETTIVRTGSLATDGTTPISWNLATTANTKFVSPFISEEISIWNDTTGSTVTITLYLISNTTLNNNDFWAEAEYLGTSSFPLGLTVDSKMALLGTPAALTSDTSTWGGSTNKYKIVLTCTPQNKGPIKVRFYAAKASATTYVDPYIYLS